MKGRFPWNSGLFMSDAFSVFFRKYPERSFSQISFSNASLPVMAAVIPSAAAAGDRPFT